MAAVSAQQIAEGLEDILLKMSYAGGPIGQVERFRLGLRDEGEVRAVFDYVINNPQRALFEVLPKGSKAFISSQGRYEMRRDHDITIEGFKAFTVDPTTYEYTEAATDAARQLFEAVHVELLQHSNIDAGTGSVGVQVSAVDLDFDPSITVQRGGWHCFKAVYRFRFYNQPEETT